MPWTKAQAKAMRRKYGLGEFRAKGRKTATKARGRPARTPKRARRRPNPSPPSMKSLSSWRSL